jgi:ATP-binding cassette, subfamily C, bacterial LapB
VLGIDRAIEALPSAATDFKSAFRTVAAFLGRPSSETVLFSGVPDTDLDPPDFDAVERLSRRIGLSVVLRTRGDLRAGNVDYPALAVFADGLTLALLEEKPEGIVCGFAEAGQRLPTITPAELLQKNPQNILCFSVVYGNSSEEATVGQAAEIEQPHWLTSTLAPFWRTYLRVALAALFINMIALVSPLFVMNVYDRVLPNEATATLWVLAIGVSLALLFDLLLKTARAALIDYAGRKADLRLSSLLFDKILNSTLASRPMSTGEYASRVTQYEFVREFFTSNTISVLIDTVFVFLFLLVIYLIAGWIVIIPALAFAAAVIVGVVAQHRIGKRVAAAANEAAQRQSLLVETISTIETVKSLRAEANLLRRWQELSKHAANTSEQIKAIASSTSNITQFVQQLVTVVIVLAGAYAFAAGDISMGAIIASVMLSGRAVAPLGQIAMTLSRLRQAMMSLRILNKIMEQEEDRPSTVGFVNRVVTSANISFQNVCFTYPGSDQQVLNGLTFAVRQGERIGIIGRIGSGKTTIGRLMGGLYPPGSGRILLDGIDIRQYHPAEVRSAVAVAGQSADLFSGTVKENLLFARPNATDEELLAVARMTGIDSFVASHPRGFDMPVGERGSQLSGGQKQAMTIARLLLAKPKIVFLDEPSGAMDLASERLLIENLKKSFESNVTVIISTHRYSMLELIDRLIVVDQGRVVADGPKKQVIEALQRNALGSVS